MPRFLRQWCGLRARPTSKPLAHTFTARCPAATARLLKQVTFGDFPAFICLASMLLEFVIGNAVVARGFSSYLVSNFSSFLASGIPVWECTEWFWLPSLEPGPVTCFASTLLYTSKYGRAALLYPTQARLLNQEPFYFRLGCGSAQGGKYDVMAAGKHSRGSVGDLGCSCQAAARAGQQIRCHGGR